jgi:hypothetical protein
MRFKIRKLRFWFDKKFGWFFINGRKQTFWCAQLRSEEKVEGTSLHSVGSACCGWTTIELNHALRDTGII